MRLTDNHLVTIRDNANELLRILDTQDVDEPGTFDQMMQNAMQIKHGFDSARADPSISSSSRSGNMALCHECLTTVSSVWRSGALGWYKAQQKKKLEEQRRDKESRHDYDYGGGGTGTSLSNEYGGIA
ncbi:hypothetical protein EV182_004355 [Spiromyces aspiralis]|uniref:Uncharacterized protein n=1 Tax=Spiromyces aspiralis TaxID=68401 RepID=A0ACC1HWN4_9FUNG|nr:hypothetical protein EV182_004355 [Spiromyces aspiralis]